MKSRGVQLWTQALALHDAACRALNITRSAGRTLTPADYGLHGYADRFCESCRPSRNLDRQLQGGVPLPLIFAALF